MPVTREQLSVRSKQLLNSVDDMFEVFEQICTLLSNWNAEYHTPFIEQVMRLQKLEAELYALGYDDEFVLAIKRVIYSSVFGNRK